MEGKQQTDFFCVVLEEKGPEGKVHFVQAAKKVYSFDVPALNHSIIIMCYLYADCYRMKAKNCFNVVEIKRTRKGSDGIAMEMIFL